MMFWPSEIVSMVCNSSRCPLPGFTAAATNVPPAPGILHAHNPDQYRGVYGAGVDPYVNDLDLVMKTATPGVVAGFVVEPIQGDGGVVPPPASYLPKTCKLVRAAGGVCIVDEIQTGFGRMGTHYWGFEMLGVVPDIVVMAKDRKRVSTRSRCSKARYSRVYV